MILFITYNASRSENRWLDFLFRKKFAHCKRRDVRIRGKMRKGNVTILGNSVTLVFVNQTTFSGKKTV